MVVFKHLDETGLRIGGKTHWLHVVATETHTWYRVAAQRKDIEVLADIKGVVVHDHWKPYYQLEDVNHALCNAHHLRELKALAEIEQESWAVSMSKLLLLACNGIDWGIEISPKVKQTYYYNHSLSKSPKA